MIVFIQRVYFTPWLSIAVTGFIWLPQIVKTAVENNVGCPRESWYTVFISFHCSFIPLYFLGTENNILFLRPNFSYFWFGVIAQLIQVLVVLKQRRKPRFFIPKFLRRRLMTNFFEYETTFSLEASLKNSTLDEKEYLEVEQLQA